MRNYCFDASESANFQTSALQFLLKTSSRGFGLCESTALLTGMLVFVDPVVVLVVIVDRVAVFVMVVKLGVDAVGLLGFGGRFCAAGA